MLVDASAPAANVTTAIRQAAHSTGTSFDYLLATAKVESNYDPKATVSTSSARGLFQFVEQTWLGVLKDAGPTHGYGHYAAAIERTASGRYTVSDPRLKREILRLRNDPVVNATMAGVFTSRNAAKLQTRLGRQVTEGELYVAHFLGSAGAARLIEHASGNPDVRATSLFPAAARANRNIFYEKGGRPRTAAEVYEVLTAKYDIARTKYDIARTGPPAAVATAVPDPAGTTAAFAAVQDKPASRLAADDGPVFHSLFRSAGPRQAVAPVVTALWGSRSIAADRLDDEASVAPPSIAAPPTMAHVRPSVAAAPPTDAEPAQPVRVTAPASAMHDALRPTVDPAVVSPPPPDGRPLDLFQDRWPDAAGLFRRS